MSAVYSIPLVIALEHCQDPCTFLVPSSNVATFASTSGLLTLDAKRRASFQEIYSMYETQVGLSGTSCWTDHPAKESAHS